MHYNNMCYMHSCLQKHLKSVIIMYITACDKSMHEAYNIVTKPS